MVLEQRGIAEPVALVREARLAYLEERVTRIERPHERRFSLAGSHASHLDEGSLEQAVRELRRHWDRPKPGGGRPGPRRAGAGMRRRGPA